MIEKKDFKKILGILVSIKILALVGVVCFNFEWIELGEKPLIAQGPKDEQTENNTNSLKGNDLNSSHSLASNEPKTSSNNFLDNLLTLPDFETESISKEEIGRYLTLIEQAKQQAQDKSEILERKIKQLKSLESGIEEKILRLDDERLFFKKTLQQEKKIQGERLETLVALYAKMEPKKAAPVFEAMDRDLAVALLDKLAKKQVTKILEVMQTEKSVELTEYFGRVGSAKEYELLKEMNQSLSNVFKECKEIGE